MFKLREIVCNTQVILRLDECRLAFLLNRCDQRTGDAQAICRAIDPERAGELMWFPASGWIHEDDDEIVATAHGSLNAYDRLVPMIILAPGRTKHAPLAAPDATVFDMTQVAALLASWVMSNTVASGAASGACLVRPGARMIIGTRRS